MDLIFVFLNSPEGCPLGSLHISYDLKMHLHVLIFKLIFKPIFKICVIFFSIFIIALKSTVLNILKDKLFSLFTASYRLHENCSFYEMIFRENFE